MKVFIELLRTVFIYAIAILIFSGCVNEQIIDKKPEAKRTVLVYIAGENSLSGYANGNFYGMMAGAKDYYNLNGGNLLVYMDTRGSKPCLIQITSGIYGAKADTVKVYEEQNSASIEVMQSVMNDVFNNFKYKTQSKGLILWSHGTAWLPSDLIAGGYLRAFGQDVDENHNSWFEINDLRDALKGYKFDFLIFDACYMGSVECLYALRDNADYILASPTEVMGDGLPYSIVTKLLFSDIDVPKFLRQVGEEFVNYYEAGGNPLWRSASTVLVKTSEFDNLAAASRAIFAGKYDKEVFDVPVSELEIREFLRSYPPHTLYDFDDFASRIATKEQYELFKEALAKLVPYRETTDVAYYSADQTTLPMNKDKYSGLSVYVPQVSLSKLNDWYKRLEWYKAVYETEQDDKK